MKTAKVKYLLGKDAGQIHVRYLIESVADMQHANLLNIITPLHFDGILAFLKKAEKVVLNAHGGYCGAKDTWEILEVMPLESSKHIVYAKDLKAGDVLLATDSVITKKPVLANPAGSHKLPYRASDIVLTVRYKSGNESVRVWNKATKIGILRPVLLPKHIDCN